MVTCTTADVEVRHPRNSATGVTRDVDFSNIAAQYVNAEYADLARAAAISSAKSMGVERCATKEAICEPNKSPIAGRVHSNVSTSNTRMSLYI